MTKEKRFNAIVIDDTPLNIKVETVLLKKTGLIEPENIQAFERADKAFLYIKDLTVDVNCKIFILLDLDMLYMNGQEFLEMFRLLPEELRAMFEVFVLSSTLEDEDRIWLAKHAVVTQILDKPTTCEALKKCLQ